MDSWASLMLAKANLANSRGDIRAVCPNELDWGTGRVFKHMAANRRKRVLYTFGPAAETILFAKDSALFSAKIVSMVDESIYEV